MIRGWDRTLNPEIDVFDADLWVRLEPKVRARLNEKVQGLIEGQHEDYAAVRGAQGYIAALRWVLDAANGLTKGEE